MCGGYLIETFAQRSESICV